MAASVNEPEVSTFHAVRAAELEAIAERRAVHPRKSATDIRQSLTGLALSGGGVRSATFSLGVLQALHDLGHLAKFDYLSTVSGGGFTGAWWTTWLSRDEFLASHIRDEAALARRLINELVVPGEVPAGIADPTIPRLAAAIVNTVDGAVRTATRTDARAGVQLLAALYVAAGDGVRDDRSAARTRLLDLLVIVLNALRAVETPPVIFTRHGDALTRLFPADENLEPQRASDYRNVKVPDGALAAGADPIHHVRLFANYLTPRKGLMTVDTWRAAAVVSRNLIFTWCVLLPILLAVVLAGQLYFVAQSFDPYVAEVFAAEPAAAGHVAGAVLWDRALVAARVPIALGCGIVIAALLWIGFNHAGSRWTHAAAMVGGTLIVAGALLLVTRPADCDGLVACVTALVAIQDDSANGMRRTWNQLFVAGIVAGLALIAAHIIAIREVETTDTRRDRQRPWHDRLAIALGRYVVADARSRFATVVARAVGAVRALLAVVIGPELVEPRFTDAVRRQVAGNRATRWHGSLLTWFALAVGTFAFAGFGHEAVAWIVGTRDEWGEIDLAKTVGAITALAAAAGSLFTALEASPSAGSDTRQATEPALLGKVVFAVTPPLVLLVLATAMAWVAQQMVGHATANWSAVGSTLTVMALIGIVIGLVYGLLETGDAGIKLGPRLFMILTAVVGIAAVAGTLYAPEWLKSAACGSPWMSWPIYAVVGYAVMAVLAVGWAYRRLGERRWRPVVVFGFCGAALVLLLLASIRLACGPAYPTTATYAAITLLIVVLGWIFTVGWMSDPNALGLHTFYKARLVRAYLGASNPERHVSGGDIHDSVIGDDMRLSRLAPTAAGGPYPLINTTLNLVGGRDLATAQRSAACFVLSPKFCGSVRTGYRPTGEYMGGKLSVGAAVATSGAAASPNMGSRTPSAALAVLLTLFNVRLGLWVPTPHKVHWRAAQARLWPFYLLRESFSQTNDLGSYCYLTDGGHFDNTGLYSLIERGCRTIVLVDNGADPKPPTFDDLGEAIRRCRIDFGAEIELTVSRFRNGTPEPAHYTLGTVHYATAHLRELGIEAGEMHGQIVWIKPSLVGTEPADVVQYGFQNPVFPQQATSDQWFEEAQFESYRQLALESVRMLLDEQPAVFEGP